MSMATELIQLDREDVVLLILEANERLLGKKWFSGITRLEKLLFLLDRETDFQGIGEFFRFEPHNFGPFSKEVYEAIEFLSSCDLITERDRSYSSYISGREEAKLLSEISDSEFPEDGLDEQVTEKQFALTDDGRKVAEMLRDSVERVRKADIIQLDGIVKKYGTRPLQHLIRYVYRQHPDMIVKSIHPEAARARNAHTD